MKGEQMESPVEIEAELSQAHLYEGINEDINTYFNEGDTYPTYVIQQGFGRKLEILEDMAKAIVSSKSIFFDLKRQKNGDLRFQKTELSQYFLKLNMHLNAYKPACRFSEYIELLFASMKKLGIWGVKFTKPESKSPHTRKLLAEHCNELAVEMQREGGKKEFKKKVSARLEKSKQNLKSAMAYECELFEWRSRLLVIRLDFGFKAEYGKEVTVAEARKYLKKFLNNRRKNKTLFEWMGGYIWALEYGCEGKGLHFHLTFFFDGSEVWKDPYVGDKIGKYWVEVITKGKGNYHNCNRNKKGYKHLGIGMVHRDAVEMRRNLGCAIEYLTKKAHCFKVEMDDGRVFGKGESPPKNLTGVGRPPIRKTPLVSTKWPEGVVY